MFKKVIILFLILCSGYIHSLDVYEILKNSDKVMHPQNLQGAFAMTLISKNGGKREISVIAYQKKENENRENRVFLFSAPPSVKGTGLLVHSYLDSNEDFMWIYLPTVGKIKRVNLSVSGGGYFMGSDFTYSDLISYSSKEIDYTLTGDMVINNEECYVIKVKGKTKAIQEKFGYSQQIYHIRKSDFVNIKIIFYDMAGDLLKELTVDAVTTLGEYRYPSSIRMENKQTGHVSAIVFSELTSPDDIPDKYFTQRYLMD
jgi:hypothetical protein